MCRSEDSWQLSVGSRQFKIKLSVSTLASYLYRHIQGLKPFNCSSFITLKCFILLETRAILFSVAVAAIIASPALILDERANLPTNYN